MKKPPIIFNTAEAVSNAVRSLVLAFVRPQYFSADPVDYQPLRFVEVLAATQFDLSTHTRPWLLTTHYQGDHRITRIYPPSSFDPLKPSLIFHHGASQTDPFKHLNAVFDRREQQAYNVYVIHAQHHLTKSDYLHHSVDTFLHHQETFAGSVLAVEAIVQHHRTSSSQPVVVAGVSMGGIVSAWHAFHFGSADLYFPMVAYPNVSEIFLSSSYRPVIHAWRSKHLIPAFLDSFLISHFDQGLTHKVFPILGSHDRIVDYRLSQPFWESRGFHVTTYPYGHFTPGIVGTEIAHFIRSHVDAIR